MRGAVAEGVACFLDAGDVTFEVFEVLLVSCAEVAALGVAECMEVGDLRFEAGGVARCEAFRALSSNCGFA